MYFNVFHNSVISILENIMKQSKLALLVGNHECNSYKCRQILAYSFCDINTSTTTLVNSFW